MRHCFPFGGRCIRVCILQLAASPRAFSRNPSVSLSFLQLCSPTALATVTSPATATPPPPPLPAPRQHVFRDRMLEKEEADGEEFEHGSGGRRLLLLPLASPSLPAPPLRSAAGAKYRDRCASAARSACFSRVFREFLLSFLHRGVLQHGDPEHCWSQVLSVFFTDLHLQFVGPPDLHPLDVG
jgi:hypothetical protein